LFALEAGEQSLKICLGHFTTSGTHSSNFFDFCEGRLETYYLRRHLDAKPDLTGTVVADLPEEVFVESSSRPFLTISSSTKCKKDKDSEITDAIPDLITGWKDPELNKKIWQCCRSRKSAGMPNVLLTTRLCLKATRRGSQATRGGSQGKRAYLQ